MSEGFERPDRQFECWFVQCFFNLDNRGNDPLLNSTRSRMIVSGFKFGTFMSSTLNRSCRPIPIIIYFVHGLNSFTTCGLLS
jgi:hypothetical protein